RVWKWRKALSVEGENAGTRKLRSRWAPETVQSPRANRRRMPTLKSKERAAKIAAKLRGRKRPQHVIDAWHAHNSPPWTVKEDKLLGKTKDREVAARTGRGVPAVRARRYQLGIPPYEHRNYSSS